ncbi:MAG: DUF459 domain-containing protein [Actinobacteria bacterium]|nr:DUF459 domain-containing protein [Actinomycetota bacterium]
MPDDTRIRATRQADRHDDPDRRMMSVGHVWIVGLVCLLVGGLLNAPGIRKTALSQDVGTERDVATTFADPLYDVSHALYIDRIRLGLQELIGRGDDDGVDLTLPSPTIETDTTIPSPEKKLAFTPAQPARLWVGGDSLSVTPGESVINQAVATQVIGNVRTVDGHVATGLARPEVFNWPGYLQSVVASFAPDVMVLTIGSNDDQALTGVGGVGSLGSPAWIEEYRRRVGGLMDSMTGTGDITLLWIGIPQMRNVTRYETRYKLINDIVKQEAAKREGRVFYVDTAALLAGPDGGYADFLVWPGGSLVKVRTGDGIHFERPGADIIANAVLAALNEAFDLTSWQRTGPTTSTTSTSTTSTTLPPTTTTTAPMPRGPMIAPTPDAPA